MQTALFKISTRLAEFIFYHDNYYTIDVSTRQTSNDHLIISKIFIDI